MGTIPPRNAPLGDQRPGRTVAEGLDCGLVGHCLAAKHSPVDADARHPVVAISIVRVREVVPSKAIVRCGVHAAARGRNHESGR